MSENARISRDPWLAALDCGGAATLIFHGLAVEPHAILWRSKVGLHSETGQKI
jgi:hypothetical protein